MAHFLKHNLLTIMVIINMSIITTHTTKLTGSKSNESTRGYPNPLSFEAPQNITCPDPEDILPCFCEMDEDFRMTLYCSNVKSEEELRSICTKEFPFTNFYELDIWNVANLTSLRSGDLGNLSFNTITITYSGLTEIETEALAGSRETLEKLDLYENKLDHILNISSFPLLKEINLSFNEFPSFPDMNSSTLTNLQMDGHHMTFFPSDMLAGLPALQILSMGVGNLTGFESGTFSSNKDLQDLSLYLTLLTTLPENGIQLHGQDTTLDLQGNNLIHIPKGSLSGINGWLSVRDNLMEELDEEVWRPLLENNDDVRIEGNPYGCGCDIAWLITNRTLLHRITDLPMCADSTMFFMLDPTFYEEEC